MNGALLTYGWVRSSYAVLRNLAEHGVRVNVADSFKTGMCQWSRYKAGFDLYPSHYRDEAGFVDRVAELCDRYQVSVIFPSHNETEILARNRERFGADRSALLPDAESCALFNNKARAYNFARSVGVPVPLRIDYADPASLAEAIAGAGVQRTVIKLLTGNSGKGVFYAEGPEQAQQIVAELVGHYGLKQERLPQVEERISGEGWGSSVLYWNGRKIAGFTHRRLREKIETGGTSTLREVGHHSGVEAAAEAIFDAIGWHGLAMAEFKVCPDTGRFWFIEVNPRLWGSLPLAVAAGVEFPWLAWLCAHEGPEIASEWQRKHRPKQVWRNRWILGDTLLAAKDIANLKPLAAWSKMFGSNADASDDFFWNDLGAFAGESVRYLSAAVSAGSLNAAEDGMLG